MDTKDLILDRIASAQRQLHEIHAALATDAPIDIAKLAEILQRPYTNA